MAQIYSPGVRGAKCITQVTQQKVDHNPVQSATSFTTGLNHQGANKETNCSQSVHLFNMFITFLKRWTASDGRQNFHVEEGILPANTKCVQTSALSGRRPLEHTYSDEGLHIRRMVAPTSEGDVEFFVL